MKRYLCLFTAFVLLMGMLTGCAGSAEEDTQEQTTQTTQSTTAEQTTDVATSEIAEDEATTVQVFAMDTYISLTAYGPNAPAALEEIAARLEELDTLLSVTDTNSEIYVLNHAGGAAVQVSGLTQSLISFSQTLSEQCNGALDISIYPLALAWGFTTEEYAVPDADTIATLLAMVDESRIEIDSQAGTVTVPDGMQIDLGALVKGYASDLASEILAEHGVEHALLSFGGSTITLCGNKVDGSLWRVAIQDPEDETSYAGILEVESCTIDTSGGYERYFTDDEGNVYWHILDPATGCPSDSGLISTTIICEDGLTGDALSTACFVMGLEASVEYWSTYGGFEFVFITEDYDIYVSEGIADSFTPVYDYADANVYMVSK